MQTSGLGYSFYFRFIPDAVLRSRTLSTSVDVDWRALKHCCSRSDHHDIVFRRKVITTSGICPPSWNFWVKQATGEVGIYTSKKSCPINIGVATEIASMSVSLVKLLVLPVWGIVSTSDLYLMMFSIVGQCRYRWKWIEHSLKHCRSRWDHPDIVFCRNVITTSGIRPPTWNFWVRLAYTPVKHKFAPKT